ncbi:MAG: hypothetical protein ABFQ64_01155 [Campylobacterota bacterium]
MKKFKNTLLSVLLFSFAFLVVHDYVMSDLGISAYQEHSLDKTCVSAKSSLDTVYHLHDSVHTMITVSIDDTLVTSVTPYTKPSYIEHSFATDNSYVLERPPLS